MDNKDILGKKIKIISYLQTTFYLLVNLISTFADNYEHQYTTTSERGYYKENRY